MGVFLELGADGYAAVLEEVRRCTFLSGKTAQILARPVSGFKINDIIFCSSFKLNGVVKKHTSGCCHAKLVHVRHRQVFGLRAMLCECNAKLRHNIAL